MNGAPGGTVSSAYISAYQNAVQIGGTGTLINYGIIHGYGGATAVVLADGTVINGASGATGAQINVGGDNALQITGTGTVTNYGTINNPVGPGNYYGIQLNGAGVINNLGTASLIRGYYAAISGGHDDTITNAGTIAVNTGGNHGTDAIKFGSGTNRLIVDPGAVFIGAVYGGSGVPQSSNWPRAAVLVRSPVLAPALPTSTRWCSTPEQIGRLPATTRPTVWAPWASPVSTAATRSN